MRRFLGDMRSLLAESNELVESAVVVLVVALADAVSLGWRGGCIACICMRACDVREMHLGWYGNGDKFLNLYYECVLQNTLWAHGGETNRYHVV